MKKMRKFCMSKNVFGIVIVIMIIGVLIAGCGNPAGGGPGPQNPPDPITYSGKMGTTTYSLKITQNPDNRATFDIKPNDAYVLTVGSKISTGKVASFSGGTFSLQPNSVSSQPFTATVAGTADLKTLSDTITWDDGTASTLPEDYTLVSVGQTDTRTPEVISIQITGLPGAANGKIAKINLVSKPEDLKPLTDEPLASSEETIADLSIIVPLKVNGADFTKSGDYYIRLDVDESSYFYNGGLTITLPDDMDKIPSAFFFNGENSFTLEDDFQSMEELPEIFTVTFESNGGSNVPEQNVISGEKITPEEPTRGGYTFAGWYTDQGRSLPFDAEESITKDMVLYADWIADEAADVLTAVPDSAGVKLTVKIDDIPAGTTNIQFRLSDQSSAYINLGSWEWEESDGIFFGKDAVEIIYPFIVPNADYTFDAEFSGEGGLTVAEASVSATAGLGKMTVGTPNEYTLSYDEGTKTISLNKTPQAPSFNDFHIESRTWEWTFWEGHNWNDTTWRNTSMRSEDPVSSVIIDSTFREKFNYNGEEFTDKAVFVTTAYIVNYSGIEFIYTLDLSDSFNFPQIGIEETAISRFNALLADIPNTAGNYTINLTEDVLDHPGFSINRTTPGIKVTLNGNGKTISWKYVEGGWGSLLNVEGVELVLEDVTIKQSTDNTITWAPVQVGNGGKLEITDGVIIDNTTTVESMDVVYLNAGTTFTISGGAIKGARVKADDHAEIIMTGGTISDSEWEGILVGKYSTLTMSGGLIENTNVGIGIFGGDSTMTNGSVIMTGGTIQKCNQGIATDEGTITMTGGTITDCEDVGIGIWKGGSVTISGNAIIQNCKHGIGTDSGTINITGGNIMDCRENGIDAWGNAASVTMSGGEIKTVLNGISIDYIGTITMTGGTISGCEHVGIAIRKNGSLTMSDTALITNVENGIVTDDGGTVNIAGGTISECLEHGIGLWKNGSLTMTDDALITNSKYGIGAYGGSTITMTGGSITEGEDFCVVVDNSTFTMSDDAELKDSQQGIFTKFGGDTIIEGGTISGMEYAGVLTGYGEADGDTFTMTGGSIIDCGGSGILIESPKNFRLNISGAEIKDNTNPDNDNMNVVVNTVNGWGDITENIGTSDIISIETDDYRKITKKEGVDNFYSRGVFTLTDIPSEFIGEYAFIQSIDSVPMDSGEAILSGAMSWDSEGQVLSGALISEEMIQFGWYTHIQDWGSGGEYTGNDTDIKCSFIIIDEKSYASDGSNTLQTVNFAVDFVDGCAEISYNEGVVVTQQ
jgi:uncharacterized repeat protein (TIGR02543 family)